MLRSLVAFVCQPRLLANLIGDYRNGVRPQTPKGWSLAGLLWTLPMWLLCCLFLMTGVTWLIGAKSHAADAPGNTRQLVERFVPLIPRSKNRRAVLRSWTKYVAQHGNC